MSDKTLLRFHKRCYDYESAYGVDLLHDCMTKLGDKITKMMKINSRIKRMDSMMIAANIRKLSRTELIYTCVAKLAAYLDKNMQEILPETFHHYCDPNNYNKTFYYNNDSEMDTQLTTILEDADKLLLICGSDYDDITEYQLMVRCLSEQTIVEESARRLRTQGDGGFHSGMLQNPAAPDATFLEKSGKEYRGYVANLKKTVLLVTDGAYSGKENRDLAVEKNIRLVNTDLSGKSVNDILADFVFNESGTKVLRCLAGYEPQSCGYTGDKSQQFHVSFLRDQCAGCPNQSLCKAKIHKRVSSVTISVKAHERAKQQRYMGMEEFRNLFRIRNGVETLPSILRRLYHADRMPVRGLIRGRFFFGCKIGALNFKKLFTYREGLRHYVPNPVLS